MRLTTIQLSGFKSFVDPSILRFDANMTGVVGPNGCGKSNIIDAVRWVMGESVASRLRGEAITDVIFSGSSSRKPVGQAMVELVFDNSDATISGEYGQYSEISVRRQVTRDGQSAYFLNGSSCRRRDITDLFLGTGLGSRSYSIIEQGMISQIIEAHPEQLRSHLEEAAGISIYRERRRETEQRIKATRENLARVRDIQNEVGKQLEHLSHQAQAAERWQALKKDYTYREAQLQAWEYRVVKVQHDDARKQLALLDAQFKEQCVAQRQLEDELEKRRIQAESAGGHLNQAQAHVYQVSAEIARLEQQISHHQENRKRLHHEQIEVDREYTELSIQMKDDQKEIETLHQVLTDTDKTLTVCQKSQTDTVDRMQAAELTLAQWQHDWDRQQQTMAKITGKAEVEVIKIDYLARQLLDLNARRESLENERQCDAVSVLDASIKQLDLVYARQCEHVASLHAVLEQHKGEHATLLEEERCLHTSLNEMRRQLHTLRGRQSSLEALQNTALRQDQHNALQWLQQHQLEPISRLGTSLQVTPEWERAVEIVLTDWLDAVLLDDPHRLTHELGELGMATITLLCAAEDKLYAPGTLAQYVRGPTLVLKRLAHIYTAASVPEACVMLGSLKTGQSVITRDGAWLASDWVRVVRADAAQSGVLARKRELRVLLQKGSALEAHLTDMGSQLECLRKAKVDTEHACDLAQQNLNMAHHRQSDLAAQLQSQRGKQALARERESKIDDELSVLHEQISVLQAQRQEAQAIRDKALEQGRHLDVQRQHLQIQRQTLLEETEQARIAARDAAQKAHTLALSLASKRAALDELEKSMTRMTQRLSQIHARRGEIIERLRGGGDPIATLQSEQREALERHVLAEEALLSARRELEQNQLNVRQLEQQRQLHEQTLSDLRETRAQQHLSLQALEMRTQQMIATVFASGFDLESLLLDLPTALPMTKWRHELSELAKKITQLEPVNLSAIDEQAKQRQRKEYLDSQLTDLLAAMETLENAIRKMDHETRARFRDTFEKVNAGMKELFPRLFGGGYASLELNSDDLLSTGVLIMAAPPGKRPSNISLLSGGEKALTAMALIFSIFKLNPSAFCLLDEVDAPLDEANVRRFSHLLSEISEKVQMIFISHNKVTMEAAKQLCGVTMREPGVSRLVQVDLNEAVKLAGIA